MVSEIKKLDKQTEDDFFQNFISDDPDDIDTLNDYFFWIAEYMASKFVKLGVDRDALEKEAYYELLDCACSYSPDMRSRFGLYALPKIQARIVNLISDSAMTAFGISSVSDILYKAKNISNRVSNNIRNDSTDWKAANALGIDEVTLNELIYGALVDTSPKDLLKKSKASFRKFSHSPSDIASRLIHSASDILDDIIDSYDENSRK